MKEPKAINDLALESEELSERARRFFPDEVPPEIAPVFEDWSTFFKDQVLVRWMAENRFKEIIDCLAYQYDSFDGEKPWHELLIDLRMKGRKDLCIALLEKLIPERERKVKAICSSLIRDPENVNLKAELAIAKGSVLDLLSEMQSTIAAMPLEDNYPEQREKLQKRMQKVLRYGEFPNKAKQAGTR